MANKVFPLIGSTFADVLCDTGFESRVLENGANNPQEDGRLLQFPIKDRLQQCLRDTRSDFEMERSPSYWAWIKVRGTYRWRKRFPDARLHTRFQGCEAGIPVEIKAYSSFSSFRRDFLQVGSKWMFRSEHHKYLVQLKNYMQHYSSQVGLLVVHVRGSPWFTSKWVHIWVTTVVEI